MEFRNRKEETVFQNNHESISRNSESCTAVNVVGFVAVFVLSIVGVAVLIILFNLTCDCWFCPIEEEAENEEKTKKDDRNNTKKSYRNEVRERSNSNFVNYLGVPNILLPNNRESFKPKTGHETHLATKKQKYIGLSDVRSTRSGASSFLPHNVNKKASAIGQTSNLRSPRGPSSVASNFKLQTVALVHTPKHFDSSEVNDAKETARSNTYGKIRSVSSRKKNGAGPPHFTNVTLYPTTSFSASYHFNEKTSMVSPATQSRQRRPISPLYTPPFDELHHYFNSSEEYDSFESFNVEMREFNERRINMDSSRMRIVARWLDSCDFV